MTARISFFNRMKEESKHHLTSLFVVVLAFLVHVLRFYFNVQGQLAGVKTRARGREMLEWLTQPRLEQMIIVVFVALFFAGEYFYYLHSRKQSDFYLSLPIKRRTQFAERVVMSGIEFAIPCTIAILGKGLIALATGYASGMVWYGLFWQWICMLLVYAVIFSSMALAMILTGNIVIAFLGFGAFASYIPVILRFLLPAFESFFYATYSTVNDGGAWYYFSPISLTFGITGRLLEWNLPERVPYLIASVIFAVIVTSLASWLYQRRPAEAAGKAMAFDKFNPFIDIAVSVPLGLWCGYFLSMMAPSEAKIWLIVGTIAGTFLIHGIMESIFEFDIRGMFAKKRRMVLAIVLAGGFLLFLQTNIERYDGYVPEAEDVESVKIQINGEDILYNESIRTDEAVKGISGEEIKTVLAFAEHLAKQQIEGNAESGAEERISYGGIRLDYQMKNGTTKARSYDLDEDQAENLAFLDAIVSKESFKDDFYDLYSVKTEEIGMITLEKGFGSETLFLNDSEKAEFIKCYLADLTDLTYTEMQKVNRIGTLVFGYQNEYRHEYSIYENFDRTLEYLKTHGTSLRASLADVELTSFTIMNENTESIELTLKDAELLEEIKEELILEDFFSDGTYIYGVSDTERGEAEILVDGKEDTVNVWVREEVIKHIKER